MFRALYTLGVVGALLLPLGLASVVHAQTPPDMVRTRDGGMVRGTIMEHVPDSHVMLQTPSGEMRRIEAADVLYAGPAEGIAPPGPSAMAQVAPRPAGVPLRLESDPPNLRFHLVTGQATATAWGPGGRAVARAFEFESLCRAPCETTLPPGNHRLALAVGDNDPIPAPSIDVLSPATLHGVYTDNTGIRIAGWTIFGVGVAAGLTVMLVPLFDDNLLGSDELWIYLGVGGGIAILAAVVGAPMGMVGDGAVIHFD